jgi:hypothetical protein
MWLSGTNHDDPFGLQTCRRDQFHRLLFLALEPLRTGRTLEMIPGRGQDFRAGTAEFEGFVGQNDQNPAESGLQVREGDLERVGHDRGYSGRRK